MAFAEEVILSQGIGSQPVQATPSLEERYRWVGPRRTGISATLSKKSRSDPELKTGITSPKPIINITKEVAEIRTQVTYDFEDPTRHKDHIAIHPAAGLHFERRFNYFVTPVTTIRGLTVIGVAR